jgi:flagellar biosynthetic protein FlhB
MASDDKTEKPTAKRKKEARQKGQVAKSADLSGSLVLVASLIALSSFGPGMVDHMASFMRECVALMSSPNNVTSANGLDGLMNDALATALATVAPIAGVCLAAGLLGNVGQIGFKPTLHGLKPDVKRLNPFTGFKNVFGTRIFFETGKALAKVAVVGAVAALALIPQITQVGAPVGTTPDVLAGLMGSSALAIAQRAAFAYLLIGVVDFIYQKRRFLKNLKMTKQEVKDEHKNYGLPPEVKAQIRRRQVQAARARMMAAVPQADVVVTNPTHFAVALKYDGTKTAPEVIAKGQDLIALQIRRIASENDVPVVENPPLARSLHKAVEIGQLIPPDMFAAVAQVLAFVYRSAGRRKAMAAR